MFEYFAGRTFNYTQWVNFVLAFGGNINEVDSVMGPLRNRAVDDDISSEYLAGWDALAERLFRMAEEDAARGNRLGASNKFLRSCAYAAPSESRVPPQPHEGRWRRRCEAFRRGIELGANEAEFVDVPYEGTSLPALFLPAGGDRPAPTVIHWCGGSETLPVTYLVNRDGLSRRGVNLLLCEQGGNGESLIERGITFRHDSEVPASACVDYLESRPDVDPTRIGIIDWSLGGYFSVRAAAFEPRLACCVAWGAIWDWHAHLTEHLDAAVLQLALPHVLGSAGASTAEEYLRWAAQLSLDGVAEHVRCPLLVVHGEHDRVAPLWAAERTVEAAVRSPQRELRIFRTHEGGTDHCQVSNISLATDHIHHWVAATLGA